MTRWSWVIDQTRCIGCHACTTACKSENDVAVGVFRTWVKNVDVGTFPEVRRHFAVLRCNHCEDAPCVEICPVTAMYQRDDGLVDFDEDLCIGCKACMQACPYDAIYMDPDSNTAAKCNFCSHRVDEGLLPACVVVCPVEALVFGDKDDPASRVSRLLTSEKVTVRRPEQKTRPHAFYIGANEATLDPLGAEHAGMYAWADGREDGRSVGRSKDATSRPSDRPPVRPPVVSYDVPRQRTWGWKVSSYIWTKSLAAGLGLIPAVLYITHRDATSDIFARIAPVLALLFLGATGALLVADLKRPERFWTILIRPQWKSWLARGAFVITAYGGLLAWWTWCSWLDQEVKLSVLAVPLAILAVLTAIYTAFLFAQCEGRDLWQSPLLAIELALHAVLAAFAMLFLVSVFGDNAGDIAPYTPWFVFALATSAVLALIDALGKHPTANATAAAHALTKGPQARMFWGSLIAGTVIPALIMLLMPALAPIAGLLALGGLWFFGHALVLAGQGPPIS